MRRLLNQQSPKADSPVNFVREKLGDELSIVRKDFLCVRALAAFRVEIVGIELPHPLEHGLVVLIHQVPVSAMPVRRIERMVPEHVLRLFRQVFLRYAVNVFVVSKRQVNVIQPAVRLVDPILCLILGLAAVWICGKEFRENHLLRVRAPGGERIAYHGPLWFPIQAEHLSKIVQKTGENEPPRMAVLANRFRGLQQVLGLRHIGIGIAIVNQRVKVLGHFPDTLLSPLQPAVFGFLLQDEIQCLVLVVLPVELRHRGVGVGLIVPELLFRFALPVADGHKIVPLIQFFQRRPIFFQIRPIFFQRCLVFLQRRLIFSQGRPTFFHRCLIFLQRQMFLALFHSRAPVPIISRCRPPHNRDIPRRPARHSEPSRSPQSTPSLLRKALKQRVSRDLRRRRRIGASGQLRLPFLNDSPGCRAQKHCGRAPGRLLHGRYLFKHANLSGILELRIVSPILSEKATSSNEFMQEITFPSGRRRWLIALFFVVSLAAAAAKKFFDYSSAPDREKESDFVYPPNTDQTKPTTLVLQVPPSSQVAFEQTGGFINDASHLNKTAVFGIVEVTSAEDIQNALKFAREHNLKVTAAGSRHSMGGQTFVQDGVVLDMRGFNQMRLDKEHKILNVQAGATWKQAQQLLDREGLAVKAMQSINIFSVGGTLSVNAHGIAHDPGQIAPTVRSIRVMLSSGEIKTASPRENPELFRLALGGYGLFGVILDTDLDVVDNEVYIWKTHYLDYKDFPEYFRKNVQGQPRFGLMFARISISPSSYLTETAVHTYERTAFPGSTPPLKPVGHDWFPRFIINFSKTGSLGR